MAEQRVTDHIEPKRAQRPDARSHPRLNWFRQARFAKRFGKWANDCASNPCKVFGKTG